MVARGMVDRGKVDRGKVDVGMLAVPWLRTGRHWCRHATTL
jgi:hypothetical protein